MPAKQSCHYCGKTDIYQKFPSVYEKALEWAESLDWLEGFHELIKERGLLLDSLRICKVHFTEQSFQKPGREGRLYPNSKPTINLIDRNDAMPMLREKRIKLESTPEPHHNELQNMSMDIDDNADIMNMSGLTDKNYTISKQQLEILVGFFEGCWQCKGDNCTKSLRSVGNTVIASFNCQSCGIWNWSSTRKLHDDQLGSVYEGNLTSVASAFLAPIPYERYNDMQKISNNATIGKTQYFNNVKSFVKPAVDSQFRIVMERTCQEIECCNERNENEQIVVDITGDAQFCSRGHSAQECRYVVIDTKSGVVLDYEMMTKDETNGNSGAMEKACLERILGRLTTEGRYRIRSLTTDKHSGIIKFMADKYSEITHYFDLWHLFKNFKKMNDQVLRLVRYQKLRMLWPKLCVHIWRSITVAGENKELAIDLIRSAIYHCQGVHSFEADTTFVYISACQHDHLDNDSKWLDPRIKNEKRQLELLEEMINNTTFLENVRRCSPIGATSCNESFNAMNAIIYNRKNYRFDKDTALCYFKMAIMHYNSMKMENNFNDRMGVKCKTAKKFSKAQSRMRVVKRRDRPTMDFKTSIISGTKEEYWNHKENQVRNRQEKRVEPSPSSTVAAIVPSSSSDYSDSEQEELEDDELDFLNHLNRVRCTPDIDEISVCSDEL